MNWTEFVSACQAFVALSQEMGDSWRAQGDPAVPGEYFISLRTLRKKKNKTMPTSEETQGTKDNGALVLTCRFDVLFSLAYSVPMMFFKVSHNDGSSLSIQEIWELVNVSSSDLWSTVSQMDHPVLQIPFFAFHACQTEKLMETLLRSTSPLNSQVLSSTTSTSSGVIVQPLEYLVSWLSFMMSSSAWVLMDEECDCGGPPPVFNLPPPPMPPNLPCELEMTCPNVLSITDAEFKKIGNFPTVTLLVSSILVSCVILLIVAGLVWKYFKLRRKKRKGVTQTKDFDHGPSMMNGNGVLYEDLSHARPRPPIAPPSIEMLDINHHPHLNSDGILGNPKLDFAYFLNPPPIYEELPDHHSDRNGDGQLSEDEFAEDELSVIDVPVTSHDQGDINAATAAVLQARGYHNGSTMAVGNNGGGGGGGGGGTSGRSSSQGSNKPRAQSLNRKQRTGSRGGGGGAGPQQQQLSNGFKSQRSLDRRGRNGSAKFNATATNPRGFSGRYTNTLGGGGMGGGGMIGVDNNNPGMLILSNQNGMTMKIPPHLLAVLTESAMCNGGGAGARPYEIIPTSLGTMAGGGHHLLHHGHGTLPQHGSSGGSSPGVLPAGLQYVSGHGLMTIGNNGSGVYPSSRSSGSSYGDGGSSSASSARTNPQSKNMESGSFDSGIGPNSITSFINSPAYDQAVLPPAYSLNTYEYASTGVDQNGVPSSSASVVNPAQYLQQHQQGQSPQQQQQQHASFRRMRLTPSDREHPLYSNHLLT